ncbi:MAG: hypothetical protein LC793_03735, partial [Thermomicrobia bacterium]|nr:hypothetical protein [Thermomicrobia bacterium]
EMGLDTRVIAPLGTHLFPFKGKMRHVTWFLMEATAETDEFAAHLGHDTFRFSPTEATTTLAHDESRALLRRAIARRGMRTEG